MRPIHILLGLALALAAAHFFGLWPWPAAPVALTGQGAMQTPVQNPPDMTDTFRQDAAAPLSPGITLEHEDAGQAQAATKAEARPSKAIAQAAAPVGPLHGNERSKVFHAPGCRYYDCKQCTAIFQSAAEAITSGYRPCRQCAQ